MVMMQSPSISDCGQPESPSSNPDSPHNNNNNNNNSNTPNNEMKGQKLEQNSPKINRYDDDSNKDVKPKFNVLSAINKENSASTIGRNNNLDQILYPKVSERDLLEPSAKFSIERLKQLADQRLSPSNIENSGLTNNNHKLFTLDHSAKYQNNNGILIQPGLPLNIDLNSLHHPHHPVIFTNHPPTPHHLNILSHSTHLNNLKYGLIPTTLSGCGSSGGSSGTSNGNVNGLSNNNNNISSNNNNNNNNELDIERIKLARTLANSKELSDFGFRIQLGGLTTNYAHSEMHSDSEELNVDGNEDSSQDENSVSCIIKSRLIY